MQYFSNEMTRAEDVKRTMMAPLEVVKGTIYKQIIMCPVQNSEKLKDMHAERVNAVTNVLASSSAVREDLFSQIVLNVHSFDDYVLNLSDADICKLTREQFDEQTSAYLNAISEVFRRNQSDIQRQLLENS